MPTHSLQTFLTLIQSGEIPFYEEDYSVQDLEALFREYGVDRNELLAYHFQKDSVAAMQSLLFHFPALWVELKREDWLAIGKYLSEDELGIYHFSFWLAEVLDWAPEQFWKEVQQSHPHSKASQLLQRAFPNGLNIPSMSASIGHKKWKLDLRTIRNNLHHP